MKKGSFIFVLHSHIPYVRKKGKWPHGEDIIFEAIAETYLPLIISINELVEEGFHPAITIGLTPILLEQLDDSYLIKEFYCYLSERIDACKQDLINYSGPLIIKDKKDREHHKFLANYYLDFYKKIEDTLKSLNGHIVKEFARLQNEGYLDIITSGATHAYLPLYYEDKAIRGQIKVAIESYKRYFGRSPLGIWLPECGYRPGVIGSTGNVLLKGIEEYLGEYNLKYFFTDSPVFSNASESLTELTKHVLSFYDQGTVSWDTGVEKIHRMNKPTYKPYKVGKSDVLVFARDSVTSLQVWSGEFGYPGDYFYREFHSKDSISGLKFCRITERSGQSSKCLYEPDVAQARVLEHANHFVDLVKRRIESVAETSGEYPCIVSSYDTELFGHWWFEGVLWIKEVIKLMEKSEIVKLTKASDYIHEYPSKEAIFIPESSWGLGGRHYVWMNSDTEYMWPIIHQANERMQKIASSFKLKKIKSFRKEILNQAYRELLLLESSDWPFLVTTFQARDYAQKRFNDHLERFDYLAELIEINSEISREEKEEVLKIIDEDNPFCDIDFLDYS